MQNNMFAMEKICKVFFLLSVWSLVLTSTYYSGIPFIKHHFFETLHYDMLWKVILASVFIVNIFFLKFTSTIIFTIHEIHNISTTLKWIDKQNTFKNNPINKLIDFFKKVAKLIDFLALIAIFALFSIYLINSLLQSDTAPQIIISLFLVFITLSGVTTIKYFANKK